MNRMRQKATSWWQQLLAVLRGEYRAIFRDEGVVLVLVFAILIYSTLYALAYGTQVLRNVPIGVIDESHTPASRQLVETFRSGPNVVVAYEPTDMVEARSLFYDRAIYGIVHIPDDYERQLLGGEQATVALYLDASYFLMYRQVFQELVAGIGTTGAMVEFQRLIARGAEIPQAEATTQPVLYENRTLFNPYLGYGSFVMPAILIVIIQQTLLIGVGMIGGTWREFGLYRRLTPSGCRRMAALPVVVGKTIAYASIYALTLSYILAIHYRLFHYPTNGTPTTIAALMAPYLLACILMSIALSTLFRTREQSILMLLWSSIPVLMLSGASLPRESLPAWLYHTGRILPSSSGVEAFIRIRSMGASFDEVWPEIRTLWMQALLYGTLALLGIRHRLRSACEEL